VPFVSPAATHERNLPQFSPANPRFLAGNPTVESKFKRAAAGASRGSLRRVDREHEAIELRDATRSASRKGVLKAVSNVNQTLGPSIIGLDALDQAEVDRPSATPTHAEQGEARCHANSSACRWPSPAPQPMRLASRCGVTRRPQRARSSTPLMNILNGASTPTTARNSRSS